MLKTFCLALRLAGPCLAVALFPTSARAIAIVPGSVTVSRSVDSGASWSTVTPAACTDVFVGDWVAVTMTLVNDTGMLGNMIADDITQMSPPGYTPGPANAALAGTNFLYGYYFGCDSEWDNNGMDSGKDPIAEAGVALCTGIGTNLPGSWPAQYWMWPLQGPCTGAPECPGPACGCDPTAGNGINPERPSSPVSLIQADDATGFNYNAQYLTRMERWDGTGWTRMAPMEVGGVITPRGYHGMAMAGGKLYVAGGRNAGGTLDSMIIYDPGSDTWSDAKAPMSAPRDRVAVVAVPGVPDKIFVIGGRYADGVTASGDVEVYDTLLGTWTLYPNALTAPRFGLAAAYAPTTGMIYVFGGTDGAVETAAIDILDPNAPAVATPGGALSQARWGLGAAFSPLDSMIYVIGGYFFGGAATDGTNDAYDPASNTTNPFGPPALMVPDAADVAVAEYGNQIFSIGGISDQFACAYGNGTQESFQGGGGYFLGSQPPQVFDTGGFWVPAGPLPFDRTRCAAASDGANLYVSGGFGLKYLNAGTVAALDGVADTSRVTWIFECKTEGPPLDFKVLAKETDDGRTGCQGTIAEGSGLDCLDTFGNGCDANPGVPTLTQILQDEFGGKICIHPPFTQTSYISVADAGGRPPQTAWIGDTLVVHTSFTNAGAAKTVSAGEDCLTPFATGVIGLVPLVQAGGCAGAFEAASPAVPFTVGFLSTGEVLWSFSVAGGCGATGSAYFESVLKGGISDTPPFEILPAPLTITATVWVDPDGAGGAFAPMPLGETTPGTAGPFYYMGQETLQVTFNFRNTDGTYAMDLKPAITQAMPDDMVMIAGPIPGGTFTLGPGATQAVTCTFAKSVSATAIFEGCGPGGLGGVNFFGVSASARGVCGSANIELRPVPFIPNNLTAGGCPGVCPPGTSGISFTAPAAPSSADRGTPYLVTLSVHNADSRPFVIEAPSASLFLDITPVGSTSYWIQSAPVFGTSTVWLADETRTFTWSVYPNTIGSVTTVAGIDFGQSGAPCLIACAEVGASGCAIDTPYVIPGQVAITGVRNFPPVMCADASNLLMSAWDISNTSATDVFQATHYGTYGLPETKAGDTGSITGLAAPSQTPNPIDPPVLIIPPLTTMTVTFYMVAQCGVVTPGVYNATTHWVDGMFTDAGTGAVTNCCDFANWGGPISSVTITAPADMSNSGGFNQGSVWTDALVYSVGQRIRVFFSLSNAGGDDINNLQMAIGQKILTQNPQIVLAPGTWPTPPNPWTYTGSGVCGSAPVPYKANQTFEWDYDVVAAPNTVAVGTFVFTATAWGDDVGCGIPKRTNDVESPIIRIANSAQLVCKTDATPLVTMAVACPTCTPMSTCDKQTGIGCINVSLVASNFGDISIVNATPSTGIAAAYLASCDPVQCTTAFAIPVTVPPESTVPGTIPKSTTVTYGWTYSPTGLGCVRILTTFTGQDAATSASLYCDQWTNCVDVLPRYPLELTLLSAKPEVTPGQTFTVDVRVCNPGGTSAGLQGGEPALQFFQIATGAKVTEQYDVTPPPPTVLAPGVCQTIQVSVTAHKNADPGMIEIRLPQGDRFIARDAATNLAFPSVDKGGPLSFTVTDLNNLLEISGPNPSRLTAAGGRVLITYAIANAGATGLRTTRLKVYTLNGELVRTLVDKQAVTERVDVAWDGRNDAGQVVASGVYIVRLEGPAYLAIKKLAIVK